MLWQSTPLVSIQRPILNDCLIDVIFDDLTVFYGLSRFGRRLANTPQPPLHTFIVRQRTRHRIPRPSQKLEAERDVPGGRNEALLQLSQLLFQLRQQLRHDHQGFPVVLVFSFI
jgi:hypothetical protein